MDHNNPTPMRVSVLHEAARLTNGDRDREYGTPVVNLSLAGALKMLVSTYVNRDLHPAEREAISMILTKLARYVTGTPKRDTCVDMAAYAAILWEVSQQPAASEVPESPVSDGPLSGGECGEDEEDETANWFEFVADYGAVDGKPDKESGGLRALREAAARAAATRMAAAVEDALRKALRDAGIEHVTFRLSFD